jgi:hypothetical protein
MDLTLPVPLTIDQRRLTYRPSCIEIVDQSVNRPSSIVDA